MEYRIRAEEALRVARARAWKRAPRYLTVIIVMVAIFAVIDRSLPGEWLILLTTLLVSLLFGLGGMFLGFKRAKKEIESYRLTVDDTAIARTQAGLAPASTDLSDITRVETNRYEALLVYGRDGKLAFGIPHTLEGLSNVVRVLEERVQIGECRPTTGGRLVNTLSYFGWVLIPIFMYVRRPDIVFISGVLLAALLGYWSVSILRNRHTTNWTKGIMGLALLLIFAAMIVPGMIHAGSALFH